MANDIFALLVDFKKYGLIFLFKLKYLRKEISKQHGLDLSNLRRFKVDKLYFWIILKIQIHHF
jgi:hypothetical protein